MRGIAVVLCSFLLVQTAASQNSEPPPELAACVKSVAVEAEAVKGDIPGFVSLTKPLAPLDLNIRRSIDPLVASSQKNYFYESMSAAAGFQPEAGQRLIAEFFTRYQSDKSVDKSAARLEALRSFAEQMRKTASIRQIASWTDGAYRINDIFVAGNRVIAYRIPEAGYFPCAPRSESPLSGASAEIKVLIAAAKPLLAQMGALGLAAAIRQQSDIRAVVDGISDNEVGFFMSTTATAVPKVFPDGKDVVFVRPLGSGVFFYGAN